MGVTAERDGLVAGIETGHVALSAVHAEILIYDWEFLILRHVVDVLEVVRTCAANVLQCGHFADLHLSFLLSLGPEVEVVDVLLECLAALSGRTLSFPSFFAQVVPFGQVEGSFEASIQVLDDAEILLLDS